MFHPSYTVAQADSVSGYGTEQHWILFNVYLTAGARINFLILRHFCFKILLLTAVAVAQQQLHPNAVFSVRLSRNSPGGFYHLIACEIRSNVTFGQGKMQHPNRSGSTFKHAFSPSTVHIHMLLSWDSWLKIIFIVKKMKTYPQKQENIYIYIKK